MVSYSEDRKFAYFDGLRFCRDEKTGYYLNAVTHKRLHRYVYERVNGKIPAGYQIHHIDHDKGNNEPENLELLTAKQHRQRHSEEMTDEQRQRRRDNMLYKAIPAAASWHRSDKAKEWHKSQYERTKQLLHISGIMICKQCGKAYEGKINGRNAFCSNACRSAWRRASGIDNEDRKCRVCGAIFSANKYAKTVCCSKSCAMRLRHSKAV